MAHPLSYQPVQKSFLPPKWRRRLLALFVLAVILVCGYFAFRLVQPRWTIWSTQRACLRYTFAPTDIAYSDDPTVVAAQRSNPDLHLYTYSGRADWLVRVKDPLEWRRLWDTGIFSGSVTLGYDAGGNGYAFLYLHQMSDPVGKDLLVDVHLLASASQPPHKYVLWATEVGTLYSPFSPDSPISEVRRASGPDGEIELPMGTDPLTIYCGQADPSDPAHFTIRFQQGTSTGTFDGRLNPTDRSVSLTLRTLPPTK